MHRTLSLAVGTALAAILLGGTAAASGAPATLSAHSGGDTIVIEDIEIPVPGQPVVPAYLVRPGHPAHHGAAGVLFLHWFEPGQVSQNRSEFLAEAVQLAERGVVCVLPQLRFPWQVDPVGDKRDADAVTAQLAAVRQAYAELLEQPGINPARTAVVGHDYGAMYGALLAQRDHRVHAEVFMSGDATWANWFDTYWLGLPSDRQDAYRAVFAGLDPVENVGRLGRHLYFQWGDRDPFVPAATRAAFAAVNPAAPVTLYSPSDHFLTQSAKDDRIAFLTAQLGL